MCQHTITTYSCQHRHYNVLNCGTCSAQLSAYHVRHSSSSSSPEPTCRHVRTDQQFRSHFCSICEDKYLRPAALQTSSRAARQLPGLGMGTMASRDGRRLEQRKEISIPRGAENRRRDRPERPLRTVKISTLRAVAPVSGPLWSYRYHTAAAASRPLSQRSPASGSHVRHELGQHHATEVRFERERRERLRAQERRAAEVSVFERDDEEEMSWRENLQSRAQDIRESVGKRAKKEKRGKKSSHCLVM